MIFSDPRCIQRLPRYPPNPQPRAAECCSRMAPTLVASFLPRVDCSAQRGAQDQSPFSPRDSARPRCPTRSSSLTARSLQPTQVPSLERPSQPHRPAPSLSPTEHATSKGFNHGSPTPRPITAQNSATRTRTSAPAVRGPGPSSRARPARRPSARSSWARPARRARSASR